MFRRLPHQRRDEAVCSSARLRERALDHRERSSLSTGKCHGGRVAPPRARDESRAASSDQKPKPVRSSPDKRPTPRKIVTAPAGVHGGGRASAPRASPPWTPSSRASSDVHRARHGPSFTGSITSSASCPKAGPSRSCPAPSGPQRSDPTATGRTRHPRPDYPLPRSPFPCE